MISTSSLIVSVVSASATAIGKELATSAVKDCYAKLKAMLSKRSAAIRVLIDSVEEDPISEPEQAVLAKKIDQAGLAEDPEVLDALQHLAKEIEALKEQAEASEAVIDFETVSIAGSVVLEDIAAQGTAFRATTAEIGGDFRAKSITQKK